MAILGFHPSEHPQGDAAYLRLDYFSAESLYMRQLSYDSTNTDLCWRLSRLSCIADVSPQNEREGLYRRAETYARKCILVDDMKPEGHTWLAASMGNIAMYEGGETKVRLARDIQRELLRALELNPGDDVAYSILGSFYRRVGRHQLD